MTDGNKARERLTDNHADFACLNAEQIEHPDMNKLPAYKITLDDGSSYVTSMAEGITLEKAKAYFIGRRLTQSDEITKLLVVNVEQV